MLSLPMMVYRCKNVNMKYSYSKLIITNILVVSWLFSCISKETKPSLNVQNVSLKPNNLASMFFNTCDNFIDFKFCPPSFLNLCLFLSNIIIKTIKKNFILYWSTAGWQCCNSFRWTAKVLSLTHVCIHSPLNSLPFPSRLPHNVEQSSLCKAIYFLKFMANPS